MRDKPEGQSESEIMRLWQIIVGAMLQIGTISMIAFPQTASAAPVTLSKGTRQLSTAELKEKLVGFEIEIVIPPEMRWLHAGEYFDKHGKYTLYEHREITTGSFSIRDDAICTKIEGEAEVCRFIFVDVDGLYWIATNRTYPDQFRQVRIKSVEK